jgi:hypothetical protein
MTVTRDRQRADILRAELLGPKRNQVLSLEEVLEAGRVLFGDEMGMALYGMTPPVWYRQGVRILGRTCVEATPDVTAGPIAQTVHALLGRADVVVDPFAGSANLMLHVARGLGAFACGLERDPAVFAATQANLAIVSAEAELRHADWESYFDSQLAAETCVYVLSPPWGEAFSFADGLDLARTAPPIPRILDTIAARDRAPRCYAVIQHTPVEPVRNVPPVEITGTGAGCIVVRVR